MKLTIYQEDFLLEYFFKNEKYPSWKSIALELLRKGQCIVAGNSCIWRGGIGNFIKTKEAENFIDCLLYEFDLEYFLSSEHYKEISNQYISVLSDKKRCIEQEYKDICNL